MRNIGKREIKETMRQGRKEIEKKRTLEMSNFHGNQGDDAMKIDQTKETML